MEIISASHRRAFRCVKMDIICTYMALTPGALSQIIHGLSLFPFL